MGGPADPMAGSSTPWLAKALVAGAAQPHPSRPVAGEREHRLCGCRGRLGGSNELDERDELAPKWPRARAARSSSVPTRQPVLQPLPCSPLHSWSVFPNASARRAHDHAEARARARGAVHLSLSTFAATSAGTPRPSPPQKTACGRGAGGWRWHGLPRGPTEVRCGGPT